MNANLGKGRLDTRRLSRKCFESNRDSRQPTRNDKIMLSEILYKLFFTPLSLTTPLLTPRPLRRSSIISDLAPNPVIHNLHLHTFTGDTEDRHCSSFYSETKISKINYKSQRITLRSSHHDSLNRGIT